MSKNVHWIVKHLSAAPIKDFSDERDKCIECVCHIFHRVDAEVVSDRRGESVHPHPCSGIQHRGEH